jgi:hypothetical protein
LRQSRGSGAEEDQSLEARSPEPGGTGDRVSGMSVRDEPFPYRTRASRSGNTLSSGPTPGVTLAYSCHLSATCLPNDAAVYVPSPLDAFAFEVGLAAGSLTQGRAGGA